MKLMLIGVIALTLLSFAQRFLALRYLAREYSKSQLAIRDSIVYVGFAFFAFTSYMFGSQVPAMANDLQIVMAVFALLSLVAIVWNIRLAFKAAVKGYSEKNGYARKKLRSTAKPDSVEAAWHGPELAVVSQAA